MQEPESGGGDGAEVEVKVVAATAAAFQRVRSEEAKGFHGESISVGGIHEVVVGGEMGNLNAHSPSCGEDAVAVLEDGGEVNVFQNVVAEDFVEGAFFKGEGKGIDVVDDVDTGQVGDVQIDPAGTDVGSASEVQSAGWRAAVHGFG